MALLFTPRARTGQRGRPYSPHVSILDGPVIGGPSMSIVQDGRVLTAAEDGGSQQLSLTPSPRAGPPHLPEAEAQGSWPGPQPESALLQGFPGAAGGRCWGGGCGEEQNGGLGKPPFLVAEGTGGPPGRGLGWVGLPGVLLGRRQGTGPLTSLLKRTFLMRDAFKKKRTFLLSRGKKLTWV